MALGMAATIRIGYRIGQGELLDARETALIAMGGTLLIALIGAAMILSKHQLVALYTTETAVATLAAELLLFVVFFCFSMLHNPLQRGCFEDTKTLRYPCASHY